MFIVGVEEPRSEEVLTDHSDRPEWVRRFARETPDARLHARPLPPLPTGPTDLSGVVEKLPPNASEWWEDERRDRFVASLSPIQTARLDALKAREGHSWRTAYRRTRHGVAVWEIRADGIAGCLRTARGGSSKQALVEAGHGEVRVRWMTPREYARLMGAPSFRLEARRNQALFGFGDAVCVPVITWLCEHYVAPVAAAPALATAA